MSTSSTVAPMDTSVSNFNEVNSLDDCNETKSIEYIDIEDVIRSEKRAIERQLYSNLEKDKDPIRSQVNTDEYLEEWVGKYLAFSKFLENSHFVGSDGVSYLVEGWTVRSKLPELFALLDQVMTQKQKIKYGCVSDESTGYDASRNAISYTKTKLCTQCIQDIMTEMIEGTECLSIYEVDDKGLPTRNFGNPLHILDEDYRGLIAEADFITNVTKLGNNLTPEEIEESDFQNITEEQAKETLKHIPKNEKGYFKYKDLIDYYFDTNQDVYNYMKIIDALAKMIIEAEANKQSAKEAKDLLDSMVEKVLNRPCVVQVPVDESCFCEDIKERTIARRKDEIESLQKMGSSTPGRAWLIKYRSQPIPDSEFRRCGQPLCLYANKPIVEDQPNSNLSAQEMLAEVFKDGTISVQRYPAQEIID